jgi:hypothetical protein
MLALEKIHNVVVEARMPEIPSLLLAHTHWRKYSPAVLPIVIRGLTITLLRRR